MPIFGRRIKRGTPAIVDPIEKIIRSNGEIKANPFHISGGSLNKTIARKFAAVAAPTNPEYAERKTRRERTILDLLKVFLFIQKKEPAKEVITPLV